MVSAETGGLATHEPSWRELERAGAGTPYVAFDWLEAWVEVYRPDTLLAVTIGEDGGGTLAVGLLERGAGGRWAFAGYPVSSHRGLLCAAGNEAAAWQALSDWLRSERRLWAILDAEGVSADASILPGAKLERVGVPGIDLPDSFDAYLAERSPGTRKGLKQKLRRLEGAEGSVREAQDRRAAMRDFLALHRERARRKNERHPQMDERLLALLERLAASHAVALRPFELVVDGRRLGVSLRLDYAGTAYFYNAGIDPDAGRLSPGVTLELLSIRDAIDRGLRRFDLGAGEYRYKTDLGGVAEDRYRAVAASPSLRGGAVALGGRAYRRSRAALAPLRRSARRLGGPAE